MIDLWELSSLFFFLACLTSVVKLHPNKIFYTINLWELILLWNKGKINKEQVMNVNEQQATGNKQWSWSTDWPVSVDIAAYLYTYPHDMKKLLANLLLVRLLKGINTHARVWTTAQKGIGYSAEYRIEYHIELERYLDVLSIVLTCRPITRPHIHHRNNKNTAAC